MSYRERDSGVRLIFSVGFFAVLCSFGHADVTLDGSLGPKGALPGPDFQITHDLGKQVGSNLYHSFGEFNISSTESATFSGPEAIQNILGRVTGGSPSDINGTLRSTIPGADLYLINPVGVVFGPNASLDVQGSFHVSTADYIRLEDGGRFNSLPSGEDQVLTIAPPEAFGFLSQKPPANIELDGADLIVSGGRTLSLIGGDIRLQGGDLIAPSGRVNIASVASEGEVVPLASSLDVGGDQGGGKISLGVRESESQRDFSIVDTRGGGAIFIRGGKLVIDRANIFASDFQGGDAGLIDITLSETILIERQGGIINAVATGGGAAGRISMAAPSIELNGGLVTVGSDNPEGGGQINVSGDFVSLSKGASINTGGDGQGGDITIIANEKMSVTGRDEHWLSPSTIWSSGGNLIINTAAIEVDEGIVRAGNGNLELKANAVTLKNGPAVTNFTDGGEMISNNQITLLGAEKVNLSDGGRMISRSATIETDHLELDNNAAIITAGRLVIAANDRVSLSNNSLFWNQIANDSGQAFIDINTSSLEIETFSQIFSDDGSVGIKGNELLIDAASIVANRAENSTNNENVKLDIDITGDFKLINAGKIHTETTNQKNGATISINAENLLVDSSDLDTRTLTDANAGDLLINVKNLTIQNTAEVGSRTGMFEAGVGSVAGTGKSGLVSITAAETVTISDFRTRIRNQSAGKGNVGNIQIKAGNLVVRNDALISASTQDAGNAGTIDIAVDRLAVIGGGRISSSGGGQIDGGRFLPFDGVGKPGNVLVKATETVSVSGQSEQRILSNGNFMVSTIASNSTGFSDAENVSITAKYLAVKDHGLIQTATASGGRGGDINISADRVQLANFGEIDASTEGLNEPNSLDMGDGGAVSIHAISVEMQDSALIRARTFGIGKPGNGGDIEIDAKLVSMKSNAKIDSTSSGEGNAGKIFIQAVESFRSEESSVTTAANQADGGNIKLVVGNIVLMQDSEITASVGKGGDGGNIDIDPRFVVLDNSDIIAKAVRGKGGNISIVSDFIFASPNSSINASSERGIDGTVNVDSPDTNISGSIAVLPESYLNASEHLRERCAARTGSSLSSFVVRGRDSIPIGPEDLSPALWLDEASRPSSSESGNKGSKLEESPNRFAYASSFSFSSQQGNDSESVLTLSGFGCRD